MNKTNDALKVINARDVHIAGMARCHIKSFPERFMTEMGCRWLCALYRFFIKHRRSICLVAVDVDGKVIGLAVGGDPHIRDEFLSLALFRYPHILFWKFLTNRLVHRVLLQELARKFRRKNTTPTSRDANIPDTGVRLASLLSICVLPEHEGTGVGGKLIESFRLAGKTEGYQRLTLSVLKENARAVTFYKKHSWYQSSVFEDSIRFFLDL